MKVLIKIKGNSTQRLLIRLIGKELAEEVKNLVNSGRHSRAIVTALSKGKFIRELAERDLTRIDADLILTEKHAHRDLLK